MPGFSLPARMHLTSLEVHHPDLGDPMLLIKRNLGSEIVREGGIRHFDDEENVAGLRQSPSLLSPWWTSCSAVESWTAREWSAT